MGHGGCHSGRLYPISMGITTCKYHHSLWGKIELPQQTQIDAKLIGGSALFGIGWGIAGMCPAPSLTLIGLGHYQALYFIVAMLLGIWSYDFLQRRCDQKRDQKLKDS